MLLCASRRACVCVCVSHVQSVTPQFHRAPTRNYLVSWRKAAAKLKIIKKKTWKIWKTKQKTFLSLFWSLYQHHPLMFFTFGGHARAYNISLFVKRQVSLSSSIERERKRPKTSARRHTHTHTTWRTTLCARGAFAAMKVLLGPQEWFMRGRVTDNLIQLQPANSPLSRAQGYSPNVYIRIYISELTASINVYSWETPGILRLSLSLSRSTPSGDATISRATCNDCFPSLPHWNMTFIYFLSFVV